MTPASSGEQFSITHGDYRATVVEVGGGIRTLEAAGVPLVQGYTAADTCDGARGQLLLPWPNRIDGGSYDFGDTRWQLPISEPDGDCAIHGLTRWATWRCVDRHADRVTLEHRLHPQPGWPGTLDLEVAYQLTDDGLSVTLSAHNIGATTAPFGVGAHPYLVAGDAPLDDWILELPASTMVATDDRGLPSARVDVTGTYLDFRTPRRIGELRLDNPFTDLDLDAAGLSAVRLTAPSGTGVTLWADHHHRWFQVFTGDALGDPARRRTAVAIEPMTCPPNAFRSGEDLVVLERDDRLTVRWGIRAG